MRGISINDIWMIVGALRWTLLLALTTFALGSVIGLMVAMARSSHQKWLQGIAWFYVELIQGIPLLGMLFLLFFGLPTLFGIDVSSFMAATIAFSLSAGAFLGEIWRGSIAAVPKGQWEASLSLGISRLQMMRKVILPQAFRLSLPPTIGFSVQLIKNTSLAALVGFVELTRSGQIVSGSTLQPLLVYLLVALCYFALCFPLARLSLHLEARFHVTGRH
ncbi:amino acid ABC transporter permease [Erwinia sp. JUb26]|uniref:amino acid ABC transporter permease n=1 Tax=Erwinia sp. JUb26 TaxID=2485126 RepID=UPI000F45F7BF|nr:amino acid ABC transporter permease [Erwinia sp. JUb26]ROR08713.1 amino acid ABC transporter membrane protein 2 (PAAT family) [Erwinia sp. JUb26]